jgi:hypothetical protein
MRVRFAILEPSAPAGRPCRPTSSRACAPSVGGRPRGEPARLEHDQLAASTQGSSRAQSGTRVVLPAPGGATSTAFGRARNDRQLVRTARSQGAYRRRAWMRCRGLSGDPVAVQRLSDVRPSTKWMVCMPTGRRHLDVGAGVVDEHASLRRDAVAAEEQVENLAVGFSMRSSPDTTTP